MLACLNPCDREDFADAGNAAHNLRMNSGDYTYIWHHWTRLPLNARQLKLPNKFLDGFEGKLTSSKWAAIAR